MNETLAMSKELSAVQAEVSVFYSSLTLAMSVTRLSPRQLPTDMITSTGCNRVHCTFTLRATLLYNAFSETDNPRRLLYALNSLQSDYIPPKIQRRASSRGERQ